MKHQVFNPVFHIDCLDLFVDIQYAFQRGEHKVFDANHDGASGTIEVYDSFEVDELQIIFDQIDYLEESYYNWLDAKDDKEYYYKIYEAHRNDMIL